MELPRAWRDSRTPLLQDGLFFLAIAMSQFCAAVGQKSVIFQYPYDDMPNIHTIDNSNITCLGDFVPYSQNEMSISLPVRVESQQGVDVYGRCLYKNPVQLIRPGCTVPAVTSFGTMFQMDIYSPIFEGHVSPRFSGTLQGIAFIITSDMSMIGEGKGYLGWLNSTINNRIGHNFAVELDFFQDAQFNDPPRVHVGVDINSLTSIATNTFVGSWGNFLSEDIGGPLHVNVWIQYDGTTQILEVYLDGWVSFDDHKPTTPIIVTKVDLTDILSHTNYIGFSGSISNVTFPFHSSYPSQGVGYSINEWTFNSDGPAPDVPRDANGEALPFTISKNGRTQVSMILVITIFSVLPSLGLLSIIYVLYRRNTRLTALAKKYKIEEGILARGPQNFKHRVLSVATNGFSSHQLLGSGGFGSVYRGRLCLKRAEKPTEIAVKRISADSHQGAQEFLAEVKIIGQVQHRNLVRLLGWCHEKGELLLVYDYMPNGSVDQHLFKKTGAPGELALTWSRRLKIVSGVATALSYLHEEWEQRVIHRDVKSSNVMLDRDFNARLGDFGLARLSEHDQVPPSTVVLAGTYGYLAPEMAHMLKVTEKTDVYSFGALILEIASGKRPVLSVEDRTNCGVVLLVDWVWHLYGDNTILKAADSRLENAFDPDEMVMFLKIGLLCSHPNPEARPTMREVLNIWKGSSPFPSLPSTKPVPVFTPIIDGIDTMVTISTYDDGHANQSGEQLTSSPQTSQRHTDGSSMPNLRHRPSSTTTPLPL